MNVAAMTGSYFKWQDIDGASEARRTMTMQRLEQVELRNSHTGKDEAKWVLSFNNQDKKLVLNKTNITQIAELWGQETDNWMGQRVILFVKDGVEFNGVVGKGLRILAKKPGTAEPVAEPVMVPVVADIPEDEIPF